MVVNELGGRGILPPASTNLAVAFCCVVPT